MVEVASGRSVQVGTVVERVHLMDADALPAGCVRLDGIEHGHWLTVREGHDEVVAVGDVVEDVLRSAGPSGGHGRLDLTGVLPPRGS